MVYFPNSAGFLPLNNNRTSMDDSYNSRLRSGSEEHIVSIPLTQVSSATGARREGQTMAPEPPHAAPPDSAIFSSHIGRRRIVADDTLTIGENEGALTAMGKLYDKVGVEVFARGAGPADGARYRSWASR